MRLTKLLIALAAAVLASVLFLKPADIHAATAYVMDESGTLTSEQVASLNSLAEEISLRQKCGVYVIITSDMHGYSESSFARGIFMNYDLGYDEGNRGGASGVLLAISEGDRYYDSVAYGAAKDTFSSYNLDRLNDLVLDYLYNGDWYGAAEGFIRKCDDILTDSGYQYYVPTYTDPAINPTTVTTSPAQRREIFLSRLPFVGVIAALLSLLITWVVSLQNTNIGIATEAMKYLVKNGVKLTSTQDIFINKTRTTTRIHRDSGGGGSSGSSHSYHSSGFSSSSGGRHF